VRFDVRVGHIREVEDFRPTVLCEDDGLHDCDGPTGEGKPTVDSPLWD
jgi:hypothetical protein